MKNIKYEVRITEDDIGPATFNSEIKDMSNKGTVLKYETSENLIEITEIKHSDLPGFIPHNQLKKNLV